MLAIFGCEIRHRDQTQARPKFGAHHVHLLKICHGPNRPDAIEVHRFAQNFAGARAVHMGMRVGDRKRKSWQLLRKSAVIPAKSV